ncbi:MULTISPECIES: zinc-binding dehydrogenase [unclassified Tolypothrix]|uniref:zinc-binding dehydrogenase n=1 Tax=unclassified Tolypothrix TaxID=2649714 RepID=UPI0005EAB107|nr:MULTISPECIES: zinc-binding dehydrogenase [unclassified Tolypothrix]BAY94760.1 alcohol dehydrogenase [Microchaete diplosiphon NIES-3275]EKE99002.1 oxidoreductase, zinc-binding dehydrogenase family protein [Tolypothrix sp. PCC 7601]MBE9081332.1 zinc-binding dehydrogenase [Tolypothrix sp. LEGE 11397]UYD28444.1 zinc-binding dehydrogenase [Tolypothrix sp. PCC 7712]UYD35677.1 zinc-binding dehydrogenase [Tolypothrix sp. PCC 7601]
MSKIRAVVVDPNVSGRLVLRDVDAPTPAANEAVIRVAAISLNRGEVRRSTTSAASGWRPGWDLAGVVETPAADGSGPAAGTRVVGLLRFGAWGELVAVPTHSLAELPASVSFEQAATLPVAGLTAYHALLKGGSLLERSVLITGASGGVGYFAIQLAQISGAQVVAHIRRPEYESFVKSAGAHAVIIGEKLPPQSEYGSYHLILESVGSDILGTSLGWLAPNGTIVLFGTSGGTEVTFNAQSFYGTGGASLYGLILFHELQRESAALGLQRLLRLVEAGQLRPHINIEADWTQIAEVAQKLLERQYLGKAVLRISN